MLKETKNQPRILFPTKLSSKMEREIKDFLGQTKMEEVCHQ